MNALRRVHAVLVPDGVVVDTQPVSARPPVDVAGAELGALDMRAWCATVESVDRLVAQTIADGLFALEQEDHLIVTDTYDSGPELLESVSGWQGTRIPPGLARRVAGAPPPVRVHQEVRLRLLRARRPGA